MSDSADNSQMAQFKVTFFDECSELLADLEQKLSCLENGTYATGDLHAIFRAVHSIKAGAGIFNFVELMSFSHHFEAMLDCMRQGRIAIDEATVALLYKAAKLS